MKHRLKLAVLTGIVAVAIPFGSLLADEVKGTDAEDGSSSSVLDLNDQTGDVDTMALKNIKVNTDVNDVFEGDGILYKFTIDEPGKVQLFFGHDWWEDTTKGFVVVSLLSSDGTTPISGNSIRTYGIDGRTMEMYSLEAGLEPGTYGVKVAPGSYWSSFADKSFTLRVNYTVSYNWETEYNNTYSTADVVKVNSDFYGSLYENGDVDFYKFTISDPGKVYLELEHPDENTGNCWNIQFFEADGITRLPANDYTTVFNGHGTKSETPVIGLKKGTYFARISSDSYYTPSTYRINVKYTKTPAWEQEPNGDLSSTRVISTNTNYYGSIISRNDVDWFKFEIPETNDVTIGFTHPCKGSGYDEWHLTLLKSDGETKVHEWDVNGNALNNVVKKLRGTFYLKIESGYAWQGQQYTLCIKDVKPLGITYTEKTIPVGETFQFSAKNASGQTVTWKVGNTSIATVSSSGKVTAKKAGNTYLYATTADGRQAKCLLKITAAKPLSITYTEKAINVGSSFTFSAKNAAGQTLTWSIGNTSIATVDKNGKVTAKAPGNTYLNVKSSDGRTAKCLIKVPRPALSLRYSEKTLYLKQPFTFTAVNAYGQQITWRVGNTAIASVDANGKVMPKKVGSTYLYAKAADGREAKCLLKVVDHQASLSITYSEKTITVGTSFQFTAKNTGGQTVTWRIGNKDIASVSSSGKVTAKTVGNTYLYASTPDGHEVKCLIKVVW